MVARTAGQRADGVGFRVRVSQKYSRVGGLVVVVAGVGLALQVDVDGLAQSIRVQLEQLPGEAHELGVRHAIGGGAACRDGNGSTLVRCKPKKGSQIKSIYWKSSSKILRVFFLGPNF